eukprot:6999626-Karenia_brevis.AAC.1
MCDQKFGQFGLRVPILRKSPHGIAHLKSSDGGWDKPPRDDNGCAWGRGTSGRAGFVRIDD